MEMETETEMEMKAVSKLLVAPLELSMVANDAHADVGLVALLWLRWLDVLSNAPQRPTG